MMSEQPGNDVLPSDSANPEGEIHLLDILIVLARHKRLVILTPILFGGVAMIASLLMAPSYTSSAKIMPPQQQQSSGVAAMLGQLGGLSGAAGSLVGLKSPGDLYVGLLESRTVSDNLIKRFNLKQRYKESTMDATRRALSAASLIASGKKDGFITITAIDQEPQFAADLANAYVDELSKLTQSMALTEASQRRMFFEKQMLDAKDQLATAEVALRATQEKTGMLYPEAQVTAIIASASQLKGTIAAKEVQLNAMRVFSAAANPELIRTQEELRGLQAQLAKLEKSRASGGNDIMVPTGKIPEVGVEYVRSVRNVKYYETIFELLAKQFELSKIDEAKDSSLIQVLDKAVPAEHRTTPRRAFITLVGLFVGAILGIVLAFMRESYGSVRKNPASAQRMQRLSSAWRGKPSS
jgi:tyrosine-protein kinase Etk/Wzc